ncbi:MAG: DUF7453 family protein [Planctomycetota bacterium]
MLPVADTPAASPAPVAAAPQMPAVDGDVIGFPGAPVPGLDAHYVTTELGWLGPDDDVVFEAVIRWTRTLELGCGILRRGPQGSVNTVLMQGQALPGTGGGRVKHPRLPLEARGDTLVIPALVEDGTIERGLFAVPKHGGTPVLLAATDTGTFERAVITDDGTVITELSDATGRSILVIPPGEEPATLCTGCRPGFSTDGAKVVVHDGDTAWSIALDGARTPLLGLGDASPGMGSLVAGVRSAWITAGGDAVLHLDTDDPARPDVLVRLGGGGDASVDVLATCGDPAPGTPGTYDALYPAAGNGDDVVFGATVGAAVGVFRARPGEATELLVASGDPAVDVSAVLAVSAPDIVAVDGRTAFGARLFDGAEIAQGVFVHGDAGGLARVLTTDAPVASIPDATLVRFLYPLREAVHVARDGRTLVHAGIREARRPDATLGALILVR